MGGWQQHDLHTRSSLIHIPILAIYREESGMEPLHSTRGIRELSGPVSNRVRQHPLDLPTLYHVYRTSLFLTHPALYKRVSHWVGKLFRASSNSCNRYHSISSRSYLMHALSPLTRWSRCHSMPLSRHSYIDTSASLKLSCPSIRCH